MLEHLGSVYNPEGYQLRAAPTNRLLHRIPMTGPSRDSTICVRKGVALSAAEVSDRREGTELHSAFP